MNDEEIIFKDYVIIDCKTSENKIYAEQVWPINIIKENKKEDEDE